MKTNTKKTTEEILAMTMEEFGFTVYSPTENGVLDRLCDFAVTFKHSKPSEEMSSKEQQEALKEAREHLLTSSKRRSTTKVVDVISGWKRLCHNCLTEEDAHARNYSLAVMNSFFHKLKLWGFSKGEIDKINYSKEILAFPGL